MLNRVENGEFDGESCRGEGKGQFLLAGDLW